MTPADTTADTSSTVYEQPPIDRSPESASPFARPNENSYGGIRGRDWDQRQPESRDLETEESPKRGEVSGRPVGTYIDRSDCDGDDWERRRKRDEEILEYDPDRHEAEGSSYVTLHEGEGCETDGNDRMRSMTLMSVVDVVADCCNADDAVETRARRLVAALDAEDTNGRSFEATVTAALVIARDEFICRRIVEADAVGADAIARADGPAERFRVLENLETLGESGRFVRGRLDIEHVEERYGFDVANAVEVWS